MCRKRPAIVPSGRVIFHRVAGKRTSVSPIFSYQERSDRRCCRRLMIGLLQGKSAGYPQLYPQMWKTCRNEKREGRIEQVFC
jgi:hypothetical protein